MLIKIGLPTILSSGAESTPAGKWAGRNGRRWRLYLLQACSVLGSAVDDDIGSGRLAGVQRPVDLPSEPPGNGFKLSLMNKI
jgi:hypothetical protein